MLFWSIPPPESDYGFAIGRVLEILIDDAFRHTVSHIAIQLFTFAPNLHPLLHLPCIELSNETIMVNASVSITSHCCFHCSTDVN